jgi:RecA/RadA recombinase
MPEFRLKPSKKFSRLRNQQKGYGGVVMLIDAEHVLRPSRGSRLAARVRATKLDRELIEGVDPATSPRLAARAAQLTARPMRAEIANGLQRLLLSAGQAADRIHVRPASRAVRANAPDLEELVELLRGDRLLYAQGLAMLHDLVVDGTGPAYNPGADEPLAQRLREARAAL